MKKMPIFQTKKNNKRATKSIDNKNIKSNSKIQDRYTFGTKKKINFINQKKEIISKNHEEIDNTKKKSSVNLSQKSINNGNKKNEIYNLSSSINNNLPGIKKRILETKISDEIINRYNEQLINAKIKNSTKRKKSAETNNPKNIYRKKRPKLSTNAINNFVSNNKFNYPNEQISFNDRISESKEGIYETDISRSNNKNVLTTFVQIEDLTKIPDRKGVTQNKYADYDYNEAKRAAVTCRRIEYSYNLRNVIKSEICLDEVIMIQRWWRDILKKKNEEILKELRIFEQLNSNNIQRYILLLYKIHYIYIVHLLNEFMNKLKIRYGKLYYKNYFNKNALKIQKAFRKSLSKRKNESQNKLAKILNKYLYKKRKEELFDEIKNIKKVINKIKFLQCFIKFYILRKQEKYRLKCAHEIHPFMFFYLKYRIPRTRSNVRKFKRKRKRFLIFVEKWKKLTRYKKTAKCTMLVENLKFIFRKKFFIVFILRIVERINAMITYFLLIPLMKRILRNYYLRKMKNYFSIWKTKDQILKNRYNLAMNLIKKTISIFTIKPLITKLK